MNSSKSYLDVSLPTSYNPRNFPIKTINGLNYSYRTNPHSSYLHSTSQPKKLLNSSYNLNVRVDKNYLSKTVKLNETINDQYKRGIKSHLDLIDFRMNYELVQAKLERLGHLLNDKKEKKINSKLLLDKENLNNFQKPYKYRINQEILLNKVEFNTDNPSYIKFESGSKPTNNMYNNNYSRNLRNQKEENDSDDNLDELADDIIKSIEDDNNDCGQNASNYLDKNSKDSFQYVEKSSVGEKAPVISKKVFKIKDGSFLSDNNNSNSQKQKMINGNDQNCVKEQIQGELSSISLQFLPNNSEKENIQIDDKKEENKNNANVTQSGSKKEDGEEKMENVTESNKVDTVLSSTVKEMIVPCNFEQLLKDEEKIPKNECFSPTDNAPMSNRENIDKNPIRKDILLNDLSFLPDKPSSVCKTEEKKNNDNSELNSSRRRVTFNDKKKVINYVEKKNVKEFKKELVEAIGNMTEYDSELNKSVSKNKNKKLKSILVKKNYGLENLPLEEEENTEQITPPLMKKWKFKDFIRKTIHEVRQMQRTYRETGQTRVSKEKRSERSSNKTSNSRKSKKNPLKEYTSPKRTKEKEGFDDVKLKNTDQESENNDFKSKDINLKISRDSASEILKNLGYEKLSRAEKQNLLREMLTSFNNESSKNYKISESNDEDKNIVNVSYLSDNISNIKSKEYEEDDRILSPQSIITHMSNIDQLPSQTMVNKTQSI